jgi:hypothetical protein
MTERWRRQKQELNSYNVFYSAIKGLDSQTSLLDIGYRVVGNFLRISDGREEVEAYPDIVLYNNESLLLVEVKSGNSVEERHLEQMQPADDISIEAVRDFLRDTDLRDPVLEPNELTNIEPLIVYPISTVESCRQSDKCSARLESMAEYASVLSQEKGGLLQLECGTPNSNQLHTVLDDGINLSTHPDTTVYLCENTEPEILSYSISMDIVRPQFKTEQTVEISLEDVYEWYRGRNISRRHLVSALTFLTQQGICRETDSGYSFSRADAIELMKVDEMLREKPVEDWIDQTDMDQSSLEQFAED